MLVDNRHRRAAVRVGQHDIARAAEVADGVAHPVVVIVVKANTGCWDLREKGCLHVPMVVESLRHIELETRRRCPRHAATRVHGVDLLADPQRVLDAEQAERVLVRHEQDASSVGHLSAAEVGASLVQYDIELRSRRRVDFENLEQLVAVIGKGMDHAGGDVDHVVLADDVALAFKRERALAAFDDIDVIRLAVVVPLAVRPAGKQPVEM